MSFRLPPHVHPSAPLCRNRECGRELFDDPGPYCRECAEEVEAFAPGQGREWYHVTASAVGDTQGSDQCAVCGADDYTRGRLPAEAAPTGALRGDYLRCDNCGERYWIRWQPSRLVVF
jgi:hypothetical protein